MGCRECAHTRHNAAHVYQYVVMFKPVFCLDRTAPADCVQTLFEAHRLITDGMTEQVTQLEQNMNFLVGTMFLVQVLISVLCALGQNAFNTNYLRQMWYVTAPM